MIKIPTRFEQAVVKVTQAAAKKGVYIPTPKQAIYPKIYPKKTASAQAQHKTGTPLPLIGLHQTQEIIKSSEPTLTTETDISTIDPLAMAGSLLFGIPGAIASAIMIGNEGKPESTKTTITGIDQLEPETLRTILPEITPKFKPFTETTTILPDLIPDLDFDLGKTLTPLLLLGGAAILGFILLKK